jgi:hypothetical protein
MDQSNGTSKSTNDRLLHLVEQQKQSKEGSPSWYAYQSEINQIIAENFLHYVNR